jgi:hypothetical protein
MPIFRATKAYNPDGLTVGEVISFAKACEERKINPGTVVLGKTTAWRQLLTELRAEGEEVVDE